MEPVDSPSLTEYLAAIRRRRTLLVSVFAPIALVAAVIAVALPSEYAATAFIDINEEQISGLGRSTGGTADSYVEEYVSNIGTAVLGRDSLTKLLQELNPYPELSDDLPAASAVIRDNTSVEMSRSTILDPNSGREREIVTAFTVTHHSAEPEVAAKVARWLAEAYVSADRTQRQHRIQETAEFYGNQAAEMGQRIAELDRKLAEFKSKNYGSLPELVAVNMNSMDRTEREIDSTNQQIRNLRENRVFLLQKLEEARVSNTDSSQLRQLEEEYRKKAISYDKNHPDMVSLSRQIESLKLGGKSSPETSLQAQLESHRAVLAQTQQRYSEDHPDVRALKRTIAALQQRIASGEKVSEQTSNTAAVTQLQTQLRALDTELAGLTSRIGELRSKLTATEGRLESSPIVETEYASLTKDQELARQKYQQLLGKQVDAQISGAAISGGKADEFTLVRVPSVPTDPAKPNRPLIVIVGLVLGFIAAASATLVAELVDATVRGSRDVRKVLGVSPIALVPRIHNSVRGVEQKRKLVTLLVSTVVGTPLLYLLVRSFVA